MVTTGYCWTCGKMCVALTYAMCPVCVVIAGDKIRDAREQQTQYCWLN
jgi:NMD protein affecting ribosome stability and mRNA decay